LLTCQSTHVREDLAYREVSATHSLPADGVNDANAFNRLLYIPFEARRIEAITNSAQSKTDKAAPKMALSRTSLAGPGYIILGGIRIMNTIGLLAVIAASVVMLVKTSVASKFFFFDAITHVLTAFTGSKQLFHHI
jgi:hypothetical protein